MVTNKQCAQSEKIERSNRDFILDVKRLSEAILRRSQEAGFQRLLLERVPEIRSKVEDCPPQHFGCDQ
ncbi:hypothetical protein NECAME_07238 [Necator americanus]|uniref:Uncharacterized protein n=1 Tax=Necator americanus TaxID=51031 RepID=W2TRL7_NECAM|nr:hypothetical protein NECAME_07238 [Necator americanus]ETN83751.1 hypothetical protein NECAME_07238 [Necator americanus]